MAKKGWKNEPARHSLAARGIGTGKYAKKVYSFDLGRTIDRTTEPAGGARKKRFDIDFRVPDAPNEDARQWTYGGSSANMEKARNDAMKIAEEAAPGYDFKIRIVDSFTGEILEEW